MIPAAYHSIGASLDMGGRIKTMCNRCAGMAELTREQLEGIAREKGRDYVMIGRRCRCRLTPGCMGWNRFWYWNAFWWPLWRDKDDGRWIMKR